MIGWNPLQFLQMPMLDDTNYATLSDKDLLAQVIGRRGAEQLYCGSFASLYADSVRPTKHHMRLYAAREIFKRMLVEEMREQPVLSSPNAMRDYLRLHYAGQEFESFAALYLDVQHRLIAIEDLFRGTLMHAPVFPREMVKRALRWNAAAVVISHNHPSGGPEPSDADRYLTKVLRDALALVDVRVLDHFVIADMTAVSFAENGWIR